MRNLMKSNYTAFLNYLHLPFNPIADPAAVVTAGNVRFTMITARLLRLEHSPTVACADRSSQALCAKDIA